MRKTAIFVFIVCIVWTAGLASQKSTASTLKTAPAPKVVMDESRHEFGDVYAGEQFFHVFIVRNAGAAALELSEGKPTSPKPPPDPHQKIKQPAQTPEGEAAANSSGSPQMPSAVPARTRMTSDGTWPVTPALAHSIFRPAIWSPAPT